MEEEKGYVTGRRGSRIRRWKRLMRTGSR